MTNRLFMFSKCAGCNDAMNSCPTLNRSEKKINVHELMLSTPKSVRNKSCTTVGKRERLFYVEGTYYVYAPMSLNGYIFVGHWYTNRSAIAASSSSQTCRTEKKVSLGRTLVRLLLDFKYSAHRGL